MSREEQPPAPGARARAAGRAWLFGDNIDTDALAPGAYMKHGIEAIAPHCLESVDPAFAASVRPGDVVVAGANFGAGSSREQAAQALKHLGIAAVVARSFAGIFYRNALNLGLVVVACPDSDKIHAGEAIEVDPEAGVITLSGRSTSLRCEAIPPHLLQMVRMGGLLPYLEQYLAQRDAAPARSGGD